jgi:hypothetical protein
VFLLGSCGGVILKIIGTTSEFNVLVESVKRGLELGGRGITIVEGVTR